MNPARLWKCFFFQIEEPWRIKPTIKNVQQQKWPKKQYAICFYFKISAVNAFFVPDSFLFEDKPASFDISRFWAPSARVKWLQQPKLIFSLGVFITSMEMLILLQKPDNRCLQSRFIFSERDYSYLLKQLVNTRTASLGGRGPLRADVEPLLCVSHVANHISRIADTEYITQRVDEF